MSSSFCSTISVSPCIRKAARITKSARSASSSTPRVAPAFSNKICVSRRKSGSKRISLAIALTAMMKDGEITRERALEIARMVMRGNALKLYSLPDANPL